MSKPASIEDFDVLEQPDRELTLDELIEYFFQIERNLQEAIVHGDDDMVSFYDKKISCVANLMLKTTYSDEEQEKKLLTFLLKNFVVQDQNEASLQQRSLQRLLASPLLKVAD